MMVLLVLLVHVGFVPLVAAYPLWSYTEKVRRTLNEKPAVAPAWIARLLNLMPWALTLTGLLGALWALWPQPPGAEALLSAFAGSCETGASGGLCELTPTDAQVPVERLGLLCCVLTLGVLAEYSVARAALCGVAFDEPSRPQRAVRRARI